MSAFIVSKKHIDAIVSSVLAWDRHHEIISFDVADDVGSMLWGENYRSYNYRYREDGPAPEYHFDMWSKQVSPVAALKAIDCLEYQSCECNDWQETKAYKWLQDARRVLISALPGYSEAAWGID